MNIVLIGYRGSGKTTIGKIIAQKMGISLIGTDALLEKEIGTTINQFVKLNGWKAFRDAEQRIIGSLAETDNAVIDTGGGVILRKENMNLLKKNGVVVFLNADAKILANRIHYGNTRPPLKEGKESWEEVEDVLKERLPLYRNWADSIVNTALLSPAEIADNIIKYFKKSSAQQRK